MSEISLFQQIAAAPPLGVLRDRPREDVFRAVRKIERAGRGSSTCLMVESFRNEREKANPLSCQLTCLSFHGPESRAWIYDQRGYRGDHGFIFFE